ncbi:MAG: GNAT family N-acetyltransferase [Pseudomonadales bacterium]
MTIRPATALDIEDLSILLTQAFSNDPLLREVLNHESAWQRTALPYFTLTLTNAIKCGYTLVDTGPRGVSIWEPPGINIPLPRQLINLYRMISVLGRNLGRALLIQREIERYRPAHPYWYLAYIATDPSCQRQGIGTSLLAPVLALADQDNQPVYLECSNKDNIGFYLNHGFNIVTEITLPGGPGIWPMLRKAG